MNQSSDGTISAASSSRVSACSAARSRSANAESSDNAVAAGGSGDGTKAATSSPAMVVPSYRPVERVLIDLDQPGTLSFLWSNLGTVSFLSTSLGTYSFL